eukprot:TRINITY_DN25573_c0_g1_i1.p1 TRINITY_DN25573_c0_g1~~TRINITY_DN25573_c0_g1_i1.p1  ORF type:complete len:2388 (+),score=410.29 TRINITY_DN25573_c0_g1_i1:162-7325(+)
MDNGAPRNEVDRRHELDCYPYSFSPLLLFADGYFDKGHSNYNSVAQFFSPVLKVDMLENVLYDRKNMLYEELLAHVTQHRMLVTCCIDSHFTAFKITGDNSLIYYDPLSSSLGYVNRADSYQKVVLYFLIKCGYGDSQHIIDNNDHYTGREANAVQRTIYQLWQRINKMEPNALRIRDQEIDLDLDRYLLINNSRDPKKMSTQLTGNTCYFQTYLFGVLCQVGCLDVSEGRFCRSSVKVRHADELREATIRMSRFLLEFFVQAAADRGDAKSVMRPLTNSNLVVDFNRYRDAAYYRVFTQYLESSGIAIPRYALQLETTVDWFETLKVLHKYARCRLEATMPSTPNTKSLQLVCNIDDGLHKLARSHYYKFRPANLTFGFNTSLTGRLSSFCEFNSLRKNQLLAFYAQIQSHIKRRMGERGATNKYRDYYFMPQFEIGQQELIDIHHYTYDIDVHSMLGKKSASRSLSDTVRAINALLAKSIFWSTQRLADYNTFMKQSDFERSKYFDGFLDDFMSAKFFSEFCGLGFSPFQPNEKELNALTQTVFYDSEMMSRQQRRMEFEFEKECINEMARSTLRNHANKFAASQDMEQKYTISVQIGQGLTYSKYNTLMHFLNVVQCYWQNPDLNAIQVFGKDIRALLAVSCQKIFFEEGHTFYHYGPIEAQMYGYGRNEMDLTLATSVGDVSPHVSREKRGSKHTVTVTERVYEYRYLQGILLNLFSSVRGTRFKSDDRVLNLSLLLLLIDFGLVEKFAAVLNLPFLQSLQGSQVDKRQLQVEVSNWISEFDKKSNSDLIVTRLNVEELIFEASYKFIVNKNFSVRSKQFELIQALNSDPANQQYVLMCKIYISLCQINKSAEVDYYKIRCNGDNRIIIPRNFSKVTGDYLAELTDQYTFTERDGRILYGELAVFDMHEQQPEINLYKVRLDSATSVESMVKYIEVSNVFRVEKDAGHGQRCLESYLIFIAGNSMLVEVSDGGESKICINKIEVEVANIFFNKAISFIPCFKYADGEDVILFTSSNFHYLIDKGGQFNENYYGMKHELMECITSDQLLVDLNDDYLFKSMKLSELLTESKTVIFGPDYLLQVQSRQQLINLLDLAVYLRNISFFILVLFYLRRASVSLKYIYEENAGSNSVTKISGPWKAAIRYVLGSESNTSYDAIFEPQFFDLKRHERLPLNEFVDVLCDNFTRYQRFANGHYQIVPTDKQKRFLQHIIRAEECFHFSEVGSGKTKVILPLLCQIFLSSNAEAHACLSRGGKLKTVLVVLVPEHLVTDACTQVFRYCLNLNFRQEYRIYDDIFALLHLQTQLASRASDTPMKQIFITSFNQFKKALTNDDICAKVLPHRERFLVVVDEVDDFLDPDKLVFNICSNKNNSFSKSTLESYFEVSRSVYRGEGVPDSLASAANPAYWQELHGKLSEIHVEIQDKSRSINKSFGIFNEQTLRHCKTNIAQDVEGYRSLIARPYASVNRAMPGSYYSDVERTIYLTYYILMEDVAKYDDLFQEERKFISFEYWQKHLHTLDFDDLVYGSNSLSVLVAKYPETKDGLTRFLYEIILRRMEIRDKARSVNSIDIVFNFDCLGFTGTPFIDNYPTSSFIRSRREDRIPDMIDRSFYVYTSEGLGTEEFEKRFSCFQGKNSNVLTEYVESDFMQAATDELLILKSILDREAPATGCFERQTTIDSIPMAASSEVVTPSADGPRPGFNVLVDLCGIFKRTSIHEVRNLLKRHFGPNRFRYVYHINQVDGSDRVLHMNSDNDVQFDEEFYKHLCTKYGNRVSEKVFFFIDNRNVIGKDIPFQLAFQERFNQPLFYKSVVVAHDVEDFSHIWQAMGRSRTMNDTKFAVYKSGMNGKGRVMQDGSEREGSQDIKKLALTRELYMRNCDRKMAGNLSSIYQTLISLFNLSQDKFYFNDEIVNVFLDKMEMTIEEKLRRHEASLVQKILSTSVPSGILTHILETKFSRSVNPAVASETLNRPAVQTLLCQIVQMKFEQRKPSGDIYDHFLRCLSGEINGTMEISYTKQQQKQKQKQTNKSHDSDSMQAFDKKHQLELCVDTDNYFAYTLSARTDLPKVWLNLPIHVPICKFAYTVDGQRRRYVNVYPTLQFLYSHHIQPEYITKEVQAITSAASGGSFANPGKHCVDFLSAVKQTAFDDEPMLQNGGYSSCDSPLDIEMLHSYIRQNAQYTLAGIQEGVYLIGMKDQFNIHDLKTHPLHEHVQYISDEMGFILFDQSNGDASAKSVDSFGPYFIEQYILIEMLSKQEMAQNVILYYANAKEKLQRGVQNYNETQGKGFICWRFLGMHETLENIKAAGSRASGMPYAEDRASDEKEMRSAEARPVKLARADSNGDAEHTTGSSSKLALSLPSIERKVVADPVVAVSNGVRKRQIDSL